MLPNMPFAIFKNLRGKMPCKHPKTCGDCPDYCPDYNDFLLSGYCPKIKKRVNCGDFCHIILIV
jgi:hypothetical protein